MKFNTSAIDLAAPENRYILTQAGDRLIAFPTNYVAGILLVERSQVLALPFYPETVLGVVHHQGQFVPLVKLLQLIEGQPSQLREVFNIVQLSEAAGTPGLGLIVDQMLGNCSDERLSTTPTIETFQPQLLEPKLWQPQRWTPSSLLAQ